MDPFHWKTGWVLSKRGRQQTEFQTWTDKPNRGRAKKQTLSAALMDRLFITSCNEGDTSEV